MAAPESSVKHLMEWVLAKEAAGKSTSVQAMIEDGLWGKVERDVAMQSAKNAVAECKKLGLLNADVSLQGMAATLLGKSLFNPKD